MSFNVREVTTELTTHLLRALFVSKGPELAALANSSQDPRGDVGESRHWLLSVLRLGDRFRG